MKQYFYIPLAHEAILTVAVDDWTSAPNFGWTIITGFYLPTSIEREGNSTVVNVLRQDRQVVYIPYTIQPSIFAPTLQGLHAFCLEGDLDYYAPEFKAILMSLEGVKAFDSAEAYLNYIASIN